MAFGVVLIVLLEFFVLGIYARGCVKTGLSCANDCKDVIFCAPTKGGGFQASLLKGCVEGYFCEEGTGECIETNKCNDGTNEESSEAFSCNSVGTFPDPVDCTKFYNCIQNNGRLEERSYSCTWQKGYSVETSSCSVDLYDNICPNMPKCTNPGEVKAWPGNENIFYVCYQSEMKLYRCPTNQIFRNGACINDEPCRQKGLMRHPDCRKYFYCDGNLKKNEYGCQESYYYSHRFRTCLRGDCQ